MQQHHPGPSQTPQRSQHPLQTSQPEPLGAATPGAAVQGRAPPTHDTTATALHCSLFVDWFAASTSRLQRRALAHAHLGRFPFRLRRGSAPAARGCRRALRQPQAAGLRPPQRPCSPGTRAGGRQIAAAEAWQRRSTTPLRPAPAAAPAPAPAATLDQDAATQLPQRLRPQKNTAASSAALCLSRKQQGGGGHKRQRRR